MAEVLNQLAPGTTEPVMWHYIFDVVLVVCLAALLVWHKA